MARSNKSGNSKSSSGLERKPTVLDNAAAKMGENKFIRKMTQSDIGRSITGTTGKDNALKRTDDKVIFIWNSIVTTFVYFCFGLVLIILSGTARGSCNGAAKAFIIMNILVFWIVVPFQNIVTLIIMLIKKLNPNVVRMVDFSFLLGYSLWSFINFIVFFATASDCEANDTLIFTGMLLILFHSIILCAKTCIMTGVVVFLLLVKFEKFGEKGKQLVEKIWPSNAGGARRANNSKSGKPKEEVKAGHDSFEVDN
jgi:hypothetical protein